MNTITKEGYYVWSVSDTGCNIYTEINGNYPKSFSYADGTKIKQTKKEMLCVNRNLGIVGHSYGSFCQECLKYTKGLKRIVKTGSIHTSKATSDIGFNNPIVDVKDLVDNSSNLEPRFVGLLCEHCNSYSEKYFVIPYGRESLLRTDVRIYPNEDKFSVYLLNRYAKPISNNKTGFNLLRSGTEVNVLQYNFKRALVYYMQKKPSNIIMDVSYDNSLGIGNSSLSCLQYELIEDIYNDYISGNKFRHLDLYSEEDQCFILDRLHLNESSYQSSDEDLGYVQFRSTNSLTEIMTCDAVANGNSRVYELLKNINSHNIGPYFRSKMLTIKDKFNKDALNEEGFVLELLSLFNLGPEQKEIHKKMLDVYNNDIHSFCILLLSLHCFRYHIDKINVDHIGLLFKVIEQQFPHIRCSNTKFVPIPASSSLDINLLFKLLKSRLLESLISQDTYPLHRDLKRFISSLQAGLFKNDKFSSLLNNGNMPKALKNENKVYDYYQTLASYEESNWEVQEDEANKSLFG